MNYIERKKVADADRAVRNVGLAIGTAGKMEGLMRAYELISSKQRFEGHLEREWNDELREKIDNFLQRVEKDKGAHRESDITNEMTALELESLFDEASTLLSEEEKNRIRDSVIRGEAKKAISHISTAQVFAERNYGDVVKRFDSQSKYEELKDEKPGEERSVDFHTFGEIDLYKVNLSIEKIIDILSALAAKAFNKDESSEFSKTVQYYLENFNKSFSRIKSESSNPRDLRLMIQQHLLESFVNLLPKVVKELGATGVLDKFNRDQIKTLSRFTGDVLYGDDEKLNDYKKALEDLFGGDGDELISEFVWKDGGDNSDESDES
jgi:hypothetical protein